MSCKEKLGCYVYEGAAYLGSVEVKSGLIDGSIDRRLQKSKFLQESDISCSITRQTKSPAIQGLINVLYLIQGLLVACTNCFFLLHRFCTWECCFGAVGTHNSHFL
jgi:hypothetical protein